MSLSSSTRSSRSTSRLQRHSTSSTSTSSSTRTRQPRRRPVSAGGSTRQGSAAAAGGDSERRWWGVQSPTWHPSLQGVEATLLRATTQHQHGDTPLVQCPAWRGLLLSSGWGALLWGLVLLLWSHPVVFCGTGFFLLLLLLLLLLVSCVVVVLCCLMVHTAVVVAAPCCCCLMLLLLLLCSVAVVAAASCCCCCHMLSCVVFVSCAAAVVASCCLLLSSVDFRLVLLSHVVVFSCCCVLLCHNVSILLALRLSSWLPCWWWRVICVKQDVIGSGATALWGLRVPLTWNTLAMLPLFGNVATKTEDVCVRMLVADCVRKVFRELVDLGKAEGTAEGDSLAQSLRYVFPPDDGQTVGGCRTCCWTIWMVTPTLPPLCMF